MFTSELDKLLISESFKDEEVEETCDAQHSEITSPDDGSGVKGNVGGKDIETEGFMWYECDIDEANVIDGDPFEFLTEAMYQNVINANNISIAVLADKYKYLRENGEEMVGEAAEAQNEKKKGAIGKWFDRVAAAWHKFITTVLERMTRMQAKFLMLFKKAKAIARENMPKKALEAPIWTPSQIADWLEKTAMPAAEKGEVLKYSDENKTRPDGALFAIELAVIQNYGKAMGTAKRVDKTAQKSFKKAKKNAESENNAEGVSYAKIGNAITEVGKYAISLIMKRINIAAKNITSSLKKEKPAKEDKKAETKEEPKADDKKTATGESAVSFLDSLDFI